MAITIKHQELNSLFGNTDHLKLSQEISFAEMIFRTLSEKEPTTQELKVFELILNLSIDHGPDTPSAIKVIEKTKEGETISEAVAEGIEEINDTHGGAQEKLMEILYKISSQDLNANGVVSESLASNHRLPGFGHRLYKDSDPRAQLILDTLKENGFSDEYSKIALDLENELQTQKGTQLPINIDGAIAVALCSFGWESRLGKAVFIIARTAGLCAHFLNNAP